jgi:hypothetical protein
MYGSMLNASSIESVSQAHLSPQDTKGTHAAYLTARGVRVSLSWRRLCRVGSPTARGRATRPLVRSYMCRQLSLHSSTHRFVPRCTLTCLEKVAKLPGFAQGTVSAARRWTESSLGTLVTPGAIPTLVHRPPQALHGELAGDSCRGVLIYVQAELSHMNLVWFGCCIEQRCRGQRLLAPVQGAAGAVAGDGASDQRTADQQPPWPQRKGPGVRDRVRVTNTPQSCASVVHYCLWDGLFPG